jgi:hypothetical protein
MDKSTKCFHWSCYYDCMHLLEVVGMSVGGCQRNIVECKRDVKGMSEDCFIMENAVESSKQTKKQFCLCHYPGSQYQW